MKDNRLTKQQIGFLLICWITYVSTYICRLNLSAIMPEMTSFKLAELAGIGSGFFISYGISQLFTGYIGDKVIPYWMTFIGLMAAALLNIGMGFASESLIAMIVIWTLNGVAQSMIWSPMLKMGGEYFEGNKKEKFGVYMTTTVPAGTIIAYGITMLFIHLFEWKYAFIGCGSVTALIALIWILYTTLVLPKYEKPGLEENTPLETNSKALEVSPKLMWKVALFTILICILPLMIHGALKDGVSSFVPTFIKDTFNVSSSFSIALTMILPIINVCGAFISKRVNKFLKNELLTSGIFFGIALIAIVILYFFSDVNVILTTGLLAIVTTSMFAVNLMLISFLPLKFSRFGKTSTMSGLLNSLAYIGCSISMVATGAIKDSTSWDGVYILWVTISAIAVILCLILQFAWRKLANNL